MVQIRLQVATVRNRLGGSLALPNPRSLFVSIGVHSRLNLSVHSGVQDHGSAGASPYQIRALYSCLLASIRGSILASIRGSRSGSAGASPYQIRALYSCPFASTGGSILASIRGS